MFFSISSPALVPAFPFPDIQALILSFATRFAKIISPWPWHSAVCQAVGACFAGGLHPWRCVIGLAICGQPSGPSPMVSTDGAQLLTQVPSHYFVRIQKSANTERCTEFSEILYFILPVSHLCWTQFIILLMPPLKVFSIIRGPECALCRVAKTRLGVWLPTCLGFKRSGKKW